MTTIRIWQENGVFELRAESGDGDRCIRATGTKLLDVVGGFLEMALAQGLNLEAP